MTAAWTGISVDQHDAHPHTGVTGYVAGGQAAVTALTPSNLPAVGSITLLTDVAGVITAQRDATETRLDALEAAVNGLIAAADTSGLTA